MSKWYPTVSTEEGAREALKAGMIGALFATGTAAIGLAVFLYGIQMPAPLFGEGETSGLTTSTIENVGSTIGIVVELLIFLFCAWRFKIGKGRYIGIVAAAFMAIEIANKVLIGKPNAGFLLMFAAIMLGLINGIRGAWAIPKLLRQSSGSEA